MPSVPVPASELLVVSYFASLSDPRYRRARRHPLLSLLFIALCALLAGADSFAQMERWAKTQEDWLKERIELPNGIPCHDTIGRLFARLDPHAFALCFQAWTRALHQHTHGEVIALDGKTIRGSLDRATGCPALHLVSAWAAANRLVLYQHKVEGHENEISALPYLLGLLDLRSCIVTGDALLCQKDIAAQVIAQGGDYVFALKDNHPHLFKRVVEFFTYWHQQGWKTEVEGETIAHGFAQSVGKGHGRREVRRCFVVEEVDWLDTAGAWEGLACVALVECERTYKGKVSRECRYFVSSLSGECVAREMLRVVRSHWGIENRLHWCLDVVFREDACRVKSGSGHGAQNLALLRKVALNLIRQETSVKEGVQAKRQMAGWDVRFLEAILTGNPYKPNER